MSDKPICPECRDGKCQACIGDAWDPKIDAIVPCICRCQA